MRMEVRIPDDITSYRERLIFGLSLRQLACFGAAAIASIGTHYLLTKLHIPRSITSYAVILIAVPILAIGFFQKNNLTALQYAKIIIRHYLSPGRRYYATERAIERVKSNNVRTTQNKSRKERNITKRAKEAPQRTVTAAKNTVKAARTAIPPTKQQS